MFKYYLKQSFTLIKQHRFYTAVYILGTGFAVTMVMIMAIVYHIRTADIKPEINRGNIFIVDNTSARYKAFENYMGGFLSYKTLKECYYSLQTPRLVAAGASSYGSSSAFGNFYTSLPGNTTIYKSSVYLTDAAFFQMFNYSFITGRPYSEEEFKSGMHYAVISEKLAYKLFNTNDIINKTVLINNVEYTVIGVVKDVSPIFSYAYSEIWAPYSSFSSLMNPGEEPDITGRFKAFILADKKSDLPLIKEEIIRSVGKYNEAIADWEYIIRDYTILNVFQKELIKLDRRTDFNKLILKYILVVFIFLLVPAINLSGIISSQIQERIGELGIRKVFGATRSTLVNQVLMENMLLTALGGIIGLILSSLVVYLMKDLMFDNSTRDMALFSEISISFSMLFNVRVFGYALGVCFILNILSSYIPVWNAARRPIVQSINDK